MTAPAISVILHTARGNHPMLGRPDVWIFDPTLRSLASQTMTDFEVIIVDLLRMDREYVGHLESYTDAGMQIYLPPMAGNRWIDAGYMAISAPKNHALVHCNAPIVVQLDDCCEVRPDFLARVLDAHRRGFCSTMPLHYHRAGQFRASGNRELVLHGRRYGFLAGAFGYSSFWLADALRINGYDEGYDGSKCLEDADFSARMHLLGRRYRLDRDHVVIEHEHEDVSPDAWPVPPPTRRNDRAIKCNGTRDAIVRARTGEDRLQANRRGYTNGEMAMYGPPCHMLRNGVCRAARLPCNWLDGDAMGYDAEDLRRVREWLPVFDLADRWRERRRCDGMTEEIPT
jgi:hypothetical protein